MPGAICQRRAKTLVNRVRQGQSDMSPTECLRAAQMSALRAQPLQDGSGWCVEVTWSDGVVEHIGTFGLESTARDWVEWDAAQFFAVNCLG
jgi:hypothetical protein